MVLINLFDIIEIDTSKPAKDIAKQISKYADCNLNNGVALKQFKSMFVTGKQKIMYSLWFDELSQSAKLQKIIQYNLDDNYEWDMIKNQHKILWKNNEN